MNWLHHLHQQAGPHTELLVNIAGWVGGLLIFVAYALLSAGRISGRSRTYQWMNVFGSAGFVINSGWKGAFPSAVLNVLWLIIGLFTIRTIARR